MAGARRCQARRQAESARRRDQPAAGDAGDAIFPERAEGRAVLAPGAGRTRPRRPARDAARSRRAGRDGHGSRRQVRHHAVALVDRAVPAVLRPPRSARGSVQRLDPPRRDGCGNGQSRHHRRDRRAARRVRGAARLQDLRRLQPRRDDGQDAGQRARPAVGGVGAGGEAGDERARRAAEPRARGGRQLLHRAVGLALLRREGAQGALRCRRGFDAAVPRARQRHCRRLRHGQPPVRPQVQGAGRPAALSGGCARLGGDRQARQARRRVPRRLLRAPFQALGRLDVGVPLAVEGGGRSQPHHRQRHELRARRGRPAEPPLASTTRARCSTSSATACTACCRTSPIRRSPARR